MNITEWASFRTLCIIARHTMYRAAQQATNNNLASFLQNDGNDSNSNDNINLDKVTAIHSVIGLFYKVLDLGSSRTIINV